MSTKEVYIIAALNKARGNTTIIKKDNKVSDNEVLCVIQIAKEGSEIFSTHLKVEKLSGSYYLTTFNKVTGCRDNSVAVRITRKQATIVYDACEEYKKYPDYHLNPYTWLLCYCLGKGFDLVKSGCIEL